ncbi:MAG TPA: DUF349 domain-containing protein, partial [Bacteroidales bacterium]|nr:DUF349 domain-containing protein [Bacteroidales bacterium]
MKSTKHSDQNPEEVTESLKEENLNEVSSEITETVADAAEISETANTEPVTTPVEAHTAEATEILTAEVKDQAEPVAELSETEKTSQPLVNESGGEDATVAEDEMVAKAPRSKAVKSAPKKKTTEVTEPENVEVETVIVDTASKVEITEEEEEDAVAEVELEENTADIQTYSREKLVSMLEAVVHEDDINSIKATVALIKVAYLARTKEEYHEMYQKAGAAEEPEDIKINDPVDDRFKVAFNIYKENKARYNDLQEQEKIKNLEGKKLILKELKELVESEETLKKTYDDFKALQERWKHIGMVPKTDANELWQNYHFLIERFFDKVKINKELKDLDLRKNLERKIELCEKAEELILESSMAKAFKRSQELHDEWKEIGPVPQDKREEVWDRFKIASDKIN